MKVLIALCAFLTLAKAIPAGRNPIPEDEKDSFESFYSPFRPFFSSRWDGDSSSAETEEPAYPGLFFVSPASFHWPQMPDFSDMFRGLFSNPMSDPDVKVTNSTSHTQIVDGLVVTINETSYENTKTGQKSMKKVVSIVSDDITETIPANEKESENKNDIPVVTTNDIPEVTTEKNSRDNELKKAPIKRSEILIQRKKRSPQQSFSPKTSFFNNMDSNPYYINMHSYNMLRSGMFSPQIRRSSTQPGDVAAPSAVYHGSYIPRPLRWDNGQAQQDYHSRRTYQSTRYGVPNPAVHYHWYGSSLGNQQGGYYLPSTFFPSNSYSYKYPPAAANLPVHQWEVPSDPLPTKPLEYQGQNDSPYDELPTSNPIKEGRDHLAGQVLESGQIKTTKHMEERYKSRNWMNSNGENPTKEQKEDGSEAGDMIGAKTSNNKSQKMVVGRRQNRHQHDSNILQSRMREDLADHGQEHKDSGLQNGRHTDEFIFENDLKVDGEESQNSQAVFNHSPDEVAGQRIVQLKTTTKVRGFGDGKEHGEEKEINGWQTFQRIPSGTVPGPRKLNDPAQEKDDERQPSVLKARVRDRNWQSDQTNSREQANMALSPQLREKEPTENQQQQVITVNHFQQQIESGERGQRNYGWQGFQRKHITTTEQPSLNREKESLEDQQQILMPVNDQAAKKDSAEISQDKLLKESKADQHIEGEENRTFPDTVRADSELCTKAGAQGCGTAVDLSKDTDVNKNAVSSVTEAEYLKLLSKITQE